METQIVTIYLPYDTVISVMVGLIGIILIVKVAYKIIEAIPGM